MTFRTMVFKPGQSGNPGGRAVEKAFASALRAVTNQADAKGRKKLHAIAEKLVDCAIAGEGWAIQQVADRLDGKPAQEATLTINNQSLTELADAEIAARIAELRAGGAGAPDGNGEASPDPSQLN
jgi:hypothetical protein